MKLPSIPKIPKMPRLSAEELREKLPFQPRREFVMSDSEHPENGAGMDYRPSTGYIPPQAPAEPRPVPQSYQNIDHEMPFRQEMVYPGGGARVPYAAGGQARAEYTGSWPPPRQAYTPAPEPQPQPHTPPQQENVPSAFARAEYYVPRQSYQPSPDFARPPVYTAPPRQDPPFYAPQQGYTAPQRAPQAAPAQPKPASKKPQPGLGIRLAAIAGSLLPKKNNAQPKASRPAAQPRQTPGHPPQGNGPAAGYQPPHRPAPAQPVRPAVSPVELKYYVWSGSIVAGLLLTVVSFIYACAA